MDQARLDAESLSHYRLLRIYSAYRLLLALLLLAMFPVIAELVSKFQPRLYLVSAATYAVLNLVTLIWFGRPRPRLRPRHYFFLFLLDIVALVLITHASSGISGGFGILLLVTVAAAAIFLPGQLAALVAAVATIAILSESLVDIVLFGVNVGNLLPAGLLGALLFATSVVIQILARRLRVSEELAEQKSEEVFSLQRLNQLIVQRMRTGIIVIDEALRIQVINEAARTLLEQQSDRLPRALVRALEDWRKGGNRTGKPLRVRKSGPLIRVNFATLQHPEGDGTLLFLEDFSQISQQAQQLKLASLGRLTASIAHEIRNPLGAISHAAQLLQEEQSLDDADRQLVEIIINHGKRMNQVIENVLYLSRGHQARPERLRLDAWLQGFTRDFHYEGGSENGARFDIDVETDDIEVSFDPGHLQQVLTNLCQNGLRYSGRATGKARLELRVRSGVDRQLAILEVVDDGTGISEEDAAHVFEPFFTTESGGTGLGLYLARELCEANQARLDYLRDDAGKSCFRLSFAHPDRRSLSTSDGAV